MSTFIDLMLTIGSVGLVVLMAWSLWNLTSAPLNGIQRLWWVFAILIVPGVGSLVWWWWIKRYYPGRKAQDPSWDPAQRPTTQQIGGRPRPNRLRDNSLRD